MGDTTTAASSTSDVVEPGGSVPPPSPERAPTRRTFYKQPTGSYAPRLPRCSKGDGSSGSSLGMQPTTAAAAAIREARLTRYLIDPRTSVMIAPWDGLTALALVFTAIMTPLEVAFLRAPDAVDGLFVCNRVVDIIFLIDMIIQFFLMYKEQPDLMKGQSARWVLDHGKIIRHYLEGWFLVDFASIVVSSFDVIAVSSADGDDANNSALSKFTAFRIIRILRLVKLVRLVRASRLYSRWEARLAINYGTLALIKAMFGVILVGHWFACIWSLQTEIAIAVGEPNAVEKSWKFKEGFCYCADGDCTDAGAAAAAGRVLSELGTPQEGYMLECDAPGRLYMASLYWSMMTITSIGYGDITPHTTYEYVVCVFLMLAGGATWGTVIATFCGVLASRDAGLAEFRQTMDDLNQFVKVQGFPRELSVRLREYFNQTKHLQMSSSHRTLLRMMSPSLQGEVALRCNERWLRRVSFLAGAEPEFMVQVALNLNAMVFAPGELAASNHLYIVHRGLALYGGRVLTSGRVWGEDMILQSVHLQTRYCARAMNYLEVYMIGREELLELATHFPHTWHSIRRHAIKLALRREFVLQAKLRVEAQNGGESGDTEYRLNKGLMEASSTKQLPAQALLHSHQTTCVKMCNRAENDSPARKRSAGGVPGGRVRRKSASAAWNVTESLSGPPKRDSASEFSVASSSNLGSLGPSCMSLGAADAPASSRPPMVSTHVHEGEGFALSPRPSASVSGKERSISAASSQEPSSRERGPSQPGPAEAKLKLEKSMESLEAIRHAASVSAAFVAGRVQDMRSTGDRGVRLSCSQTPAGRGLCAQKMMSAATAARSAANQETNGPQSQQEQLEAIRAIEGQLAEAMALQGAALRTLMDDLGEVRSTVTALAKSALVRNPVIVDAEPYVEPRGGIDRHV